ncbi:hypothetical protein F6P94_08235 [Escherichia coli]|nr:hypothetical protein F6P94_08235 [Escherichia coli]
MTAWTATSEKRYLHRILNRLDRFNSVFIKHDRSLPAQRISLLHTEYTVLHLTMRLSKHLVIFIQGDKNRTMVKDFFKMILA